MNEELDSKLESIEKEFLVSESQIIKAKATLSDIAYKRNYWKNDNPPDIDETTLNNIEDGIARAYAALNETRQMLTQANERTGIEQILGFGDNLTNAVNQLNTRTGIEQNLEFGDNLTDAVNQLNSNIKPQTLKPINGNNQVTLHRMGHLRILQLNDTASSNGGVIGKLPLPTDYPDVLVRSVCVYGNANVGTIYVRYDDGEFGVRGINPSTDPITTNIRANVVWTVK